MTARVGHWRCRYRILGSQAEGEAAVDRLRRISGQGFATALGCALDRAFEGDTAVYVLRRIPADVLLLNALDAPESTLADRWAEMVCGAVVRGIAHDAGDCANLVRFEDESDYVVHFIADVLAGRAWDCWYYGAFADLRRLPANEAALAAIMRNREHIAAILRRLFKIGLLHRALALLGPDASAKLWRETSAGPAVAGAEDVRPFVIAATRLARALDLWIDGAPAEDAIVAAYLEKRPLIPDWRDRRALAAALFQVFRFMIARGFAAAPTRSRREQLSRALEDLDWLDREWLADAIASLGLPSRADDRSPVSILTPAQQTLLAQMRAILESGSIELNRATPDSPENALRIYAALLATDSRWESEPWVREVIARILDCWKWTIDSPAIAHWLHSAAAAPQLRDPFFALPAAAIDAFQALGALQLPALEILRVLTPARGAAIESANHVFESGCAGLFLLVRALLDARIPQLARSAGIEVESFLLALGVMWAGPSALIDSQADPGLALWAGLAPELAPVSLPAESDAIQDALLEILTLRRRIDPSTMRQFELDLRGRRAVVASDATGSAWPIGAWIPSTGSLADRWRKCADRDAAVVASPPDDPQKIVAPLIEGWPAGAPINLTALLTSISALRLWTAWLPGLSRSNAPYILANLIRRSGRIGVTARAVEVRLDPGPMDVVLEMAGYLREIETVPWLAGRAVIFVDDRSRT